MINLIEASRGTEKKERLCVYAMHVMELTERSSAIRMVHKARKNGLPFWNEGGQLANSDQIVVAFEAFQHLSKVSIRPMTAISAVAGMHEDICGSAERKRAAMIVLPFHKHQRLDGSLETTRAEFRAVNRRVLEHAPCSVGILVDRGLGGATHVAASSVSSTITVLFFGGRDDCEALAFGLRMAEHPGISLTVVHISAVQGQADENALSQSSQNDKSLAEVRQKISNNGSITYEERRVGSGSEAIEAIRELSRCNLLLVGRSPQGVAANSISVKSDCPELGPVGGLLTSADFSTSASVLVVQQHHGQAVPASATATATATATQVPASAKVEVMPEDEDEDLEANV